MSPSQFEVPEIATVAALLPAFEIEHLIAQGEVAAIYKARQISLDRDVAIKILPRERGNDPLYRSSFEAEAKAMASLSHANLIRVFDSGEVDGLLYMVMEYVPGKSLHHSAHGKAIDPKQAVGIILAACEGLAHAHENGIIHRDIRQNNILLTPDAQPKIGDFGLVLRSAPTATSPYLAPEIASYPEHVNAQTDIYAIGMVLSELLTGTTAGTEEFETAIIPDTKLATICRKATHEEPTERYQDTASFSQELNLWNTAKPVRTLTTSLPPRSHHPSLAKKPTKYVAKAPSESWALLRNCALIAALFCAIHLMWGLYQNKQENLAHLQQEQDSKHPTIRISYLDTESDADRTSSQGLGSALASTNID
jgi:serine/threonine protein kinase